MDERADEVRALARLGFQELAGAAGGIGAIHRAVADRAFGASGARAGPVRVTHDAIAGSVYAGVRGGVAVAGRVADAALARRDSHEPRALSTSPRGAAAIGALDGLIGDRLEREGSALAEPMSVRRAGRVVATEPDSLAAAFPRTGPRLVVFLHGLMETELAWRLGAGADGETYGSRLERELGLAPVYLRFNSGRHVSENGRELADLLEAVVANWPVEVERIALVGHSMGGLLARSACHHAKQRDHAWVGRITHVISLGSPHTGAPLAQGVHWASAVLHALPETRPLASFLRRRSSGIRDLRQGSLVDEDWRGCEPDALRASACREIPLLAGATHCFVAGTITRSGRHPLGRLLGDCLVLESSAWGHGRTRRIPFEAEYGLHVGATHHLALLNHPAVYERLAHWLAPRA